MLRSPLPAIPPFKGAKLPEDSETTIPAVRLGLAPAHSQVVGPPDLRYAPSPGLNMGDSRLA